MSQHKNIIWRPDLNKADTAIAQLPPSRFVAPEMFANIHLMIGYCPQTTEYYQKMIEELRKTFPQADPNKIGCHQVTDSDYCNRFTLITYDARIEYKEYEGWRVMKQPDYCW